MEELEAGSGVLQDRALLQCDEGCRDVGTRGCFLCLWLPAPAKKLMLNPQRGVTVAHPLIGPSAASGGAWGPASTATSNQSSCGPCCNYRPAH